MTFADKSPDPSVTVETSAKTPRRPKKTAVAAPEGGDVSLSTITTRLLAIAAMGEANGAGPIKDLNASIRWMRNPAAHYEPQPVRDFTTPHRSEK